MGLSRTTTCPGIGLRTCSWVTAPPETHMGPWRLLLAPRLTATKHFLLPSLSVPMAILLRFLRLSSGQSSGCQSKRCAVHGCCPFARHSGVGLLLIASSSFRADAVRATTSMAVEISLPWSRSMLSAAMYSFQSQWWIL